ncbi:hypothetical protein TEA_029820 [Camellia sinensis var. sinensis]|uniref:Protein kinase domain-containing protein n=1 Tax=Camellia sinensis var. sinensis TaxID=542762 RepID=A0A4S4D390_CAMSN|nr:hypothetical protein TEA_029820 [Camellia sinensis var. sinensis]
MGRIEVYRDTGRGDGFNLIHDNQQGSVYMTWHVYNTSYVHFTFLTPNGTLKLMYKDEKVKNPYVYWMVPVNRCDIYGVCGPFGVCNNNMSPNCECLKGFVPNSIEDWKKGNWAGGCVRKADLQCQKNTSSLASSGKAQNDGFWKLRSLKLPDHYEYLYTEDSSGCQQWCLRKDKKNDEKFIISFTTIFGIVLLGAFMCGLHRWIANQRVNKENRKKYFEMVDSVDTSELPIIDFDKILAATDNFSTTNKLGEGGFGPVYMGKLEDGQLVAVKRLSRHSGQGVEEFKNEIILISKLQHRNLVRLLGCCIKGEEKLLVYEYMTNKSLDTFLFDATKRVKLDWAKRFYIIQGIARGLLYLHRDSCLRVIHRDLKVGIIFLDDDMNPKISNFGLARTFQVTRELANTHRVVGTFGYMSPEHAMGGLFSEKSDVYSFGVLLLEMVNGMRNMCFHYHEKYLNLLGYAWKLCNESRASDLVDEVVIGSCSWSEVMRCIHIGLLCVQDHVADRPTMSAVVLMLSSEIDLPHPKQPTFTIQSLSWPYGKEKQRWKGLAVGGGVRGEIVETEGHRLGLLQTFQVTQELANTQAWELYNKSRASDIVDEVVVDLCLNYLSFIKLGVTIFLAMQFLKQMDEARRKTRLVAIVGIKWYVLNFCEIEWNDWKYDRDQDPSLSKTNISSQFILELKDSDIDIATPLRLPGQADNLGIRQDAVVPRMTHNLQI